MTYYSTELAAQPPAAGVGDRPIDHGVDRTDRSQRQITTDAQTGITTERFFDDNLRLVRVVKRAPRGNRSESTIDPLTGQVSRLTEFSLLPDGNRLTREVSFPGAHRSSESVSIVNSRGQLVRMVEREHRGAHAVFQSETLHSDDGIPISTTNQHMDPLTGELTHREQVSWLAEGRRAMTEHFYFDRTGMTTRYVKTLHYMSGAPFSEETQEFAPGSRLVRRRILVAFSPEGYQNYLDILDYNPAGEVVNRASTFFDSLGRPLGARSQVPGSGSPT